MGGRQDSRMAESECVVATTKYMKPKLVDFEVHMMMKVASTGTRDAMW